MEISMLNPKTSQTLSICKHLFDTKSLGEKTEILPYHERNFFQN